MKSDAMPKSGGKHKERRPAAPGDQNKNSNLNDRAQGPANPSGGMAEKGYDRKSM